MAKKSEISALVNAAWPSCTVHHKGALTVYVWTEAGDGKRVFVELVDGVATATVTVGFAPAGAPVTVQPRDDVAGAARAAALAAGWRTFPDG